MPWKECNHVWRTLPTITPLLIVTNVRHRATTLLLIVILSSVPMFRIIFRNPNQVENSLAEAPEFKLLSYSVSPVSCEADDQIS